jgi:hypothetical protein
MAAGEAEFSKIQVRCGHRAVSRGEIRIELNRPFVECNRFRTVADLKFRSPSLAVNL